MQSLLLVRSLRRPEFRAHFAERCGRLPPDLVLRLASLSRRPIWIQAVSVGEVMLARTLMTAMEPAPCVISSTTPSGRESAALISAPGLAGVFHFPLDWPSFVRRALDAIRPSVFVTVETEIWPAMLAECGRRSIPVLIVNGRVSEKSCRRYRRFARALRGPLDAIRLACMQSDEDAGRLMSIGVPAGRVVVTGNMKYDAPEAADDKVRQLATAFGITAGVTPVLVAGSTSPGEEKMILSALATAGLSGLTLILAPRHRERFEEVARLLDGWNGTGIPYVRRSRPDGTKGTKVFLLDTLGELTTAYRLATIAFVGGSLVARGGQNLIEPASAGVPVLFGPHTRNFSSIADALIAAGAGARVSDVVDLAKVLSTLLSDPGERRRMGDAGRRLASEHCGATRRTIDRIRPFLE